MEKAAQWKNKIFDRRENERFIFDREQEEKRARSTRYNKQRYRETIEKEDERGEISKARSVESVKVNDPRAVRSWPTWAETNGKIYTERGWIDVGITGVSIIWHMERYASTRGRRSFRFHKIAFEGSRPECFCGSTAWARSTTSRGTVLLPIPVTLTLTMKRARVASKEKEKEREREENVGDTVTKLMLRTRSLSLTSHV